MSSSDASDLVDSDEDGVAPAPAPSPSRKRLLRVGSSPLPASTSSPARAGGKKRKRLEGGDGSIPGLPSRAKGKRKAASCSSPAGSPPNVRKNKPQVEHSSSSWHGSSSSSGSSGSSGGGSGSGSGSDNNGGPKRTKSTRGAAASRTATARSGGRLDSTRADGRLHGRRRPTAVTKSCPTKSGARSYSQQDDSDSSYIGSEDANGSTGSEEEEHEVEFVQRTPAAKAKGGAAPSASSASRRSHTAARNTGDNDGRKLTRSARGAAASRIATTRSGGRLDSTRADGRLGGRRRPTAVTKSDPAKSGARSCSLQDDSDSSYVGSEDANGSAGSEEEEHEVEFVQRTPAAKAKGGAAPSASSASRRSRTATRNTDSADCATPRAVRSGARTRPMKTAETASAQRVDSSSDEENQFLLGPPPAAARETKELAGPAGPGGNARRGEDANDRAGSEEDEHEVEFVQHTPAAEAKGGAAPSASSASPRSRTAARNTDGADCATPRAIRSGARTRPKKAAETASAQRVDSGSDEENQFLLPPAAAKATKEPAGPGGSANRGGSGGGSSGLNPKPIALSDDDDDCLRNTDSDDAAASGGSGGDDGGGSDNGDPVLCRCGARGWQDGARWIRCDAGGCRTWEHIKCAYPEKDNEGGKKRPPEFHLCRGCKSKGSSAAAVKERKGRRRSLTRCGGDGLVASSSEPLSPEFPSPGGTAMSCNDRAHSGGGGRTAVDDDTGKSPVRRSRRVSGREERRVPLRKNVVGDEQGYSSCSDDEMGMWGGDGSGRGGCGSGGGRVGGGSSNADSEADSDGFWAPEGQVEISQEYRCRCGGTLQNKDESSGGGGGVDGTGSGPWVQCHNDACGVWEHAACCDFGCLSAKSTLTTTRKCVSRHWCRACDPKGTKHAKWKEKRREKLKRVAKGAAALGGSRAAGAGAAAAEARRVRGKKKTMMEERYRTLLEGLWGAVVSGNAPLLKQAFHKVDGGNEGSDISVERLLEAGQPPPAGRLNVASLLAGDGDGGGSGGEVMVGGGNESPVPEGRPFPTGLTLLMLAAGYWKNVVDESTTVGASSAAAAFVDTSGAAKSRPLKTAMIGVRSATPTPSTSNLLSANGAPEKPAAVAAADTSAGREEQAETPANNETSVPPELAGVDVPSAPSQTLASATSTGKLPELGTEARLEVLRLVLERSGARAVLAVDEEGRTAVHHAAAVNGEGEAALLLGGELGGKAALVMSQERLTPLHITVAAGHLETCVSILTALPPGPRAAVLAASDKQASGENALHLACLEGRAACVQAILDEEGRLEKELADEMTSHVLHGVPAETPPSHQPLVLAKTLEGTTSLMAAAGCPSPSCVKAVIENLRRRTIPYPGSKLAELRAVDHSGMNALHYAAGRDAEGSVGAAKAVLDAERSFACHVGAEWSDAAMINSGDANNEASPLHLAAAISHKQMVSLLLAEGANSVLEDRQGWTPVMYADFGGRKEGAILELLQHEPEKQLEALGRVLSSGDGRGHHSRIVEVVRNLVTVPSFFSLVNGFIRKKPDLLLGSLSFLKSEPGLLDFENKRNLMRTLLANPDEDTRNALDLVAGSPAFGFGYSYDNRIQTRRGAGQALSSLLAWMESAAFRWSESGLAAWLRGSKPSFTFEKEAGYGQGVDREAWEMIAGDLVLPYPPPPPPPPPPQSTTVAAAAAGAGAGVASGLPSSSTLSSGGVTASAAATPAPATKGDDKKNEPFFIPVDGGMSSYCPRDLRGGEKEEYKAGAGGAGGGGTAAMLGRLEKEKDLQAFELLGIVIGANLGWNKVLNLNLNPVVWKTILSRKVHLSDLNLVDPTYYKSLTQVLEMEGVDQLGLSFECLELKFCADAGGVHPDDDVTDENKAQYASLAVESRTFGRWRKQARALSHGLRRLVPLSLLKMFTENELGLLLAGPGEIDPDDWERNTVFNGEASAILKGWFWSVVRSLTKEEKSLLLQFATGCSRLPAGGFKGLARTFMVMIMAYHPDRPLPMAATCFFTLKLPRYPDLYSLRKYLLVAIRHGSAGFEFS